MNYLRCRLALALVMLAGCARDVTDLDDGGLDSGRDAVVADATDDADAPADGAEPDGNVSVVDAAVTPGCEGMAPACFGRDFNACGLGLGCTWTLRCLGFAARCADQPTMNDCSTVMGCAWNDVMGKCRGAQTACGTLQDEPSCNAQPGCAYAGGCGGQIARCDTLDEATCGTQARCMWRSAP